MIAQYLIVCPLNDSGSIPSHGQIFPGIFPWLITLCQPILNQCGTKWLTLPSMAPHNLWTSRRKAEVQPRTENSWKIIGFGLKSWSYHTDILSVIPSVIPRFSHSRTGLGGLFSRMVQDLCGTDKKMLHQWILSRVTTPKHISLLMAGGGIPFDIECRK